MYININLLAITEHILFKEMDGKYVGSRPIKLRKSNWKDRNLEQASQLF